MLAPAPRAGGIKELFQHVIEDFGLFQIDLMSCSRCHVEARCRDRLFEIKCSRQPRLIAVAND